MGRLGLAIPVVLVFAVQVACDGVGANGPGRNDPPDGPTPLRLELRASATSVSPGDPVELTWVAEGEAPVVVTIVAGSGAPAWDDTDVSGRTNLRVNPLESTEYVLRARDPSGTVEASVTIEVVPRLEPRVAVLEPGEEQRFWVAGARGPYTWSATQGILEGSDYGPARWTAPATPGTYEVRVGLPGRAPLAQRIEVRAKPTIAAAATGVLGQPDVEKTRDVVAGDDGVLWARADEGLVLRREPGARWTIANDGLAFAPLRIAGAPGGAAWAVGHDTAGADPPAALGVARWDPLARRWVEEFGPWGSRSGTGHHLAVGANGAVVVGDSLGRLWARFSPSATWRPLPEIPHAVVDLAVGADVLYARSSSAGGVEDLASLVPGAAAWTVLVPPAFRPSGLGLDSAGRLVVWGQGVARLREDGTWEELSDGLPSSETYGRSLVEDLAFVGDRLVAVTAQGVFARDGGGTFAWLAPLPSADRLGSSLLTTGNGEVLLVDGQIWRLPVDAPTFVPLDGDGQVGRDLYPSAFAFLPDGTVAVATSSRRRVDQPPVVHLRAARTEGWVELPTGAGTGSPIVRMFFDRDGALLAASDRELLRIPTDGEPAAALPGLGLPASARILDFAVGPSGSRYAAVESELGFFELSADGDKWVQRSPELIVRDLAAGPDGSVWMAAFATAGRPGAYVLRPGADAAVPVGVGPVHDPRVTLDSIEVTPDGAAWAMSLDGILRLEDGAWRQVGSGRCSDQGSRWSISADGRVFCADERHLYVFDEVADDWVRFASRLHPGGSFMADAPRAMGAAPDGSAWLGFRIGGVFQVEP